MNWPVNLYRKQDWHQTYVYMVLKCQQFFNLLKLISGCTKMHKIPPLKKIFLRPHGPTPAPYLGSQHAFPVLPWEVVKCTTTQRNFAREPHDIVYVRWLALQLIRAYVSQAFVSFSSTQNWQQNNDSRCPRHVDLICGSHHSGKSSTAGSARSKLMHGGRQWWRWRGKLKLAHCSP